MATWPAYVVGRQVGIVYWCSHRIAEVHNWHCWMQQWSPSHKHDRSLSNLRHDQLHWFNVSERIKYKLAVMVRRCLTHLSDHSAVAPTSKIRQQLSVDCTALVNKKMKFHRTFRCVDTIPEYFGQIRTSWNDFVVAFIITFEVFQGSTRSRSLSGNFCLNIEALSIISCNLLSGVDVQQWIP